MDFNLLVWYFRLYIMYIYTPVYVCIYIYIIYNIYIVVSPGLCRPTKATMLMQQASDYGSVSWLYEVLLIIDNARCSRPPRVQPMSGPNVGLLWRAGVAWKNRPPKTSPGGNFLTDGDRETFDPRRFIHDPRL